MPVREATPDDVEAIRRVAATGWHAAYDDVIGADAVDRQLATWYDPAGVRDRVTAAAHHVLLAGDRDRIVGFAHGAPSPDGPADATVIAIYVAPDRWGEGFGTDLLLALCDRLRGDGHDDLWLDVLADNDVGRSFYRSHGFERLGRFTDEIGGVEVTHLRLHRSL